MNSIAVITARGGSKRIPRKNIRPFCGKPIIAYSIEAALASGLFREVMVSTEDMEIAEIARQYGAAVPFMRSPKTSDDYATTRDVLAEVLSDYKTNGMQFDYLCCLYPTAPFVTPQKLQDSFATLQEQKADALVPIVRFDFPIQRALRVENGRLRFVDPEHAKTRSQDLEPRYHDCGQFYWYVASVLANAPETLAKNTTYFEIPDSEVRDIDTPEDWKIAEALYRCQQ